MNFQSIVNIFITLDPLQRQLTQLGLYTQSLQQPILDRGIQFLKAKRLLNMQQALIKNVVKNLQAKGSILTKLKMISFIMEASKHSQFDIADIIISKNIKLFTKINRLKLPQNLLDKKTLELFINSELIIPIYNYTIKLAMNQQIYRTCKKKIIPQDQIFRRGTNIRFIWILKIYNILNLIFPVIYSLIKIIKIQSNCLFYLELISKLYQDLLIFNNFIVTALIQTSQSNYLLMPYFDMLQFYQSLIQQFKNSQKILEIRDFINNYQQNQQKKVKVPKLLNLSQESIENIQVHALRVKLISNVIKNPKKDYTRLETQYNQKSSKNRKRQQFTEFQESKELSFAQKYKGYD